MDDDAAFDALAPVDVVANTVRGTTSVLLLDKVKPGGTYASVTGVPDSAKSRLSVRAVAFDSKQDPKTLLYMAEAVKRSEVANTYFAKTATQGCATRSYCNGEGRRRKKLLVA